MFFFFTKFKRECLVTYIINKAIYSLQNGTLHVTNRHLVLEILQPDLFGRKPRALPIHCTKYAGIRRCIYQRRVKKQHLRIYYSHLYHTVFPCNHLISTAGLSFLPHITSIPLLFGFVFVQPPLNPPLF